MTRVITGVMSLAKRRAVVAPHEAPLLGHVL